MKIYVVRLYFFLLCMFHCYILADTSSYKEILIAEPTSQVQLEFPYNVNTRYVDIFTTGSGSVTPSPTGATGINCATVTAPSGTGAAAMLSKARLRNHVGLGQVGVFSAVFRNIVGALGTGSATGIANNSRLIGLGNLVTGPANPTGTASISTAGVSSNLTNIQDGFFFGYLNDVSYVGPNSATANGSTFGIIHRQGGSTVGWYPYTVWNGDPLDGTGTSGISLQPGNGNVYRIQYKGIGFGAIKFYVENPNDGSWVLVHTIDYPNSFTDTNAFNATLRLYATSINNNTASAASLETCSMAGIIEGQVNTSIDIRNSASNAAGVSLGTTYTTLLTILNNTRFNTTANQVLVQPDMISFLENEFGDTPIEFTLFLNATLGAAPTFSAPTVSSVVSFSTTATTISGGVNLGSFYLANRFEPIIGPNRPPGFVFGTVVQTEASPLLFTERYTYSLKHLDIILFPGDRLTVAARTVSAGTATGYVSLSWRERL